MGSVQVWNGLPEKLYIAEHKTSRNYTRWFRTEAGRDRAYEFLSDEQRERYDFYTVLLVREDA